MRHQRFASQMPPTGILPPLGSMLMKTWDVHTQYRALHADRPETPMTFDEGVLHFWPFAKYAVAFPKRSRSIATRANSARKLRGADATHYPDSTRRCQAAHLTGKQSRSLANTTGPEK